MKTTAVLAALLAAAPLAAQDWVPVDPRTRGIGGAGVAFADGATAAYWNPARLAGDAAVPVDLLGGFGGSAYAFAGISVEGDTIADADRVADLYADLDFQAMQNRFNTGTHTAQDVRDVMTIIDAILELGEEGNGVLGHAGGGFDLRVGNLGVFGREIGRVGVDPFFSFGAGSESAITSTTLAQFFLQLNDNPTSGGLLSPAGQSLSALFQACGLGTADNDLDFEVDADELAYQSQVALGDAAISDPAFRDSMCAIVSATVNNAGGSSQNTLFFNDSGLAVTSLRQREFGVSFGYPVVPGLVDAGISLKEIVTESFYTVITLEELEDGEDFIERARDEYDSNRKRSNDFNVDLGVNVTPAPGLSLGLTVRNAIPMEVSFAGPGDIEQDPNVRLGASFKPFDIVRIGLDVDLVENETDLLDGYASRMIGGGAEVDLVFVKIRGGYFDNLADVEAGGAFTGGLGFSVLGVSLDVTGHFAPSDVTIERESSSGSEEVEIPERLGLSAALTVEFLF